MVRLAVVGAMLGIGAANAAQDGLVPDTAVHGPVLQFDWPDIQVGVGTYEEGPTGLTIIRFMHRASAVVDSRGGAPGTVNTDLLRLGYDTPRLDAIVFSGGSAYGEEAITATMTGLKDAGARRGAWDNIALVPLHSDFDRLTIPWFQCGQVGPINQDSDTPGHPRAA